MGKGELQLGVRGEEMGGRGNRDRHGGAGRGKIVEESSSGRGK